MALFLLSLPSKAAPPACLSDAASAGFGGLLWRARQSLLAPQPFSGRAVVAACRDAQISSLVEGDIVEIPADDPLVAKYAPYFALRRSAGTDGAIDPRRTFAPSGMALAVFGSRDAVEALVPRIVASMRDLRAAGVDGVVLRGAPRLAPDVLNHLLAAIRREVPDMLLLLAAEEPGGLVQWAPGSGGNREREALVEISDRGGTESLSRRMFDAVVAGRGMIVPAEIAASGDEAGRLAASALRIAAAVARFPGELRELAGSGAPVKALVRGDAADMRYSTRALLVLYNSGATELPAPGLAALAPFMGADFAAFTPFGEARPADGPLAPHEARLFVGERAAPILLPAPGDVAADADRLVIEDIRPRVDGGAFAVKRIVGETVTVAATIFADGHEQLAAEALWRAAGEADWQRVRMMQAPNDQWRAAFPLPRLGRHEFRVEAWLDRFGGYRRDLAKKLEADVAQSVDYAEGRLLVEQAVGRARGEVRLGLEETLSKLSRTPGDERAATLLMSPEVAALMDRADDRPHCLRSPVQAVDAERTAAGFSSWYELFPRSQTDSPARHGTFADVIARLPAISMMGFDTLYFPPIHPIGRTNRKGRNNTLTPSPDDPGSPYAIGSEAGGHDALHPQLGTFEDFARLVEAAHVHGLEIALDFAIQCSPDHPWLQQHPGWFAWRPDGSMRYAENPPKKYQDIVNVDFYAADAVPDLWIALRDVVLHWVSHGVKTFRVDNPHTKPLPFWEWMIGAVRARHPDVIFLAEAFTRPAMMYRLGKIGFSQSYTYFTWRDGKRELIDYIVELTTSAPREFYRPHLFVNTPDINPVFLQKSGRPGFRIRAVLAATLSGLFGVYSGFELCEAAALPGKEEYLDSEKFEVKPRDWDAPGNIIADLTLLNRLRRRYPALQTHLNTRFYVAQNNSILWYGKPAPDGSHIIMVMVSLDPHQAQEAQFEVPLWEFGLSDTASVAVEDLAHGHRFGWQGKTQHIRLDPLEPYRIWRIAPGDDL